MVRCRVEIDPDIAGFANHAFRLQKSEDKIPIVTGSAHQHCDRMAIDSDLQRLLDNGAIVFLFPV